MSNLSLPPISVGPPLATRATLLGTSMLTVMAGAIIAASIPEIDQAFGDVPRHDLLAKLMLSMPALAIALFAPVSGVLIDAFGRRPLMLVGLGCYALTGSTGLYLEDPYSLLAGRFALGLAVAMMMTSGTTLVSDYFPIGERARFMGLQAAFMAFGGVVLLPLGGLLAKFSWHTPFLIYILSVPLWFAAYRYLPEPEITRSNPAHPQNSPRSAVPWLTVLMLLNVAFLGMIAFYLGPPQVPAHLKAWFAAGPTRVSFALASMTLGAALMSLSSARIARVLPGSLMITLMFALVGTGYTAASLATTEPQTWAALLLSGIGSGLVIPVLSTWMMRVAPPSLRGRFSGALISALFLGQFLSPILVQPLVEIGSTRYAFRIVGETMLGLTVVFALGSALQKLRRPARLALAEPTPSAP